MLDRWHEPVREARSFFETGVGVALFSMPAWHKVLVGVSEVAQFITVITGAIIGLHGVYRIIRRYWKHRRPHLDLSPDLADEE